MKKIKYLIFAVSVLLISATTVESDTIKSDSANIETIESTINQDSTNSKLIYIFDIKEEIAPAAWRKTLKAFKEATEIKADYIIIHMNTYGGMVNMADSIRTKIINSGTPVFVFIDNNAASAGALISIATDSIYMRKGASIGAATVVNQSGEVVPDKYQSYMRATMRATAESHGSDTIINGNDTIIKWHRNPRIAEAMVDPSLAVEGVIDSGKVLTFTASEAMKHGFCEGTAENIEEVIAKAGINEYRIIRQNETKLDKVVSALMSPALQGILLMIIIGGIYFELQTPGIGFPIAAAATAALLYFAPLYLEGLAENWELIMFFAGLVLLAFEIFVIPGFGIAGIAGIICIVFGLTLAMIDNIVFTFEGTAAFGEISRAFLTVIISFAASLTTSIYVSKKVFTAQRGIFSTMALKSEETRADGYISVDMSYAEMVGKEGIAFTVLRPSGRVEIEGELYDAKSEIGFIERGEAIKVFKHGSGQLYVMRKDD